MVSHAGLSRFVTQESGDYAVFDNAAHAWDDLLFGSKYHVAGGCAHDHQHLPGFHDAYGRYRHVGVHVCDRHGRARQETGHFSHLLREFSCFAAQRINVPAEFLVHQVFQPRIEGFEEFLRRIAFAFAPYSLVSGSAAVSPLIARKFENYPVSRLYEFVGRLVDLRRLVEYLHYFGNKPFRRYFAAVSLQKVKAHGFGYLIEPVRFRLRSMVFPQLYISMRVRFELIKEAERCTVGLDRQHRACRKVYADAYHILRRNSGFLKHCRYGFRQHLDVVSGMFERPVGFEFRFAVRQVFVHDPVGIFLHRGRDDVAGIGLHQHRPARLGTEIDAQ